MPWRIAIDARPKTKRDLKAVLAAVTILNIAWLRDHPGTPALYKAGVKYKREPSRADLERAAPGAKLSPVEVFRTIPAVLEEGWGDCDDLASWRAAELRSQGVKARAVLIPSNTPGVLYHVVVRLPDGSIDDPSIRLGMGRREG